MPFPNRLHGLFSTSLATILLMTILSWIPTSTIISGQDSGLDRKADFGFSGMDVFRLGAAGGPWHASDLDNDGDLDLTIWIDDRGELVHFLRDPESEGFVHMEAGNTLVDPAGWRRMETSVGASVEALTSLDLNADGWSELIISCPSADRLEIFWGNESEELRFRRSDRIRMEDLARGAYTLAAEQISSSDEVPVRLRVLTGQGIRTLQWKPQSTTLIDNTLIQGSAGGARFLAPTDVDGDRARDLVTISTSTADRPYPVRLRLQSPGSPGEWSPEQLLKVESGRYLGHSHTDGQPTFFFGERDRPVLTGYQVVPSSGPQDSLGVRVLPLSADGLGKSRMAQGDLDGDGDLDVVVLNTRESRLIPIFNESGKLFPGAPSPTLQKPEDLFISGSKVYVFSKTEGGLGVSELEDRGFSFPVIQKMTRDLDSLVAIGGLAANEELLSLHKVSRGNYELVLGEQGFPLGNMNREPSTVRIFPGKSNTSLVVVEIPFGAPRLFSLSKNTDVVDGESSSWELTEIESPATIEAGGKITSLAPGKILVTQKNRGRLVELDGTSARVLRQLDVPGTGAEIVEAAALQFGSDSTADRTSIALIDQGSGMIHLANESEILSSQEGPFKKVLQAESLDLGNGNTELLLLNDRALMVVGRTEGSLEMLETFTRRARHENSRITGMATGDLNGDGRLDLAAIDGARGELEILAGTPKGFEPALGFPVFEKKTFSGGGRGVEPRAILVRDFNGDGLDDVILLIHDRWIMYPQQNLETAGDSR